MKAYYSYMVEGDKGRLTIFAGTPDPTGDVPRILRLDSTAEAVGNVVYNLDLLFSNTLGVEIDEFIEVSGAGIVRVETV